MNTFGRLLRLTTWGESHGLAIGAVVDGFPAGFALDLEDIQRHLDRRAPGRSKHTSPRYEADKVEFLSGLFEGRTTGTPIAFVIRNGNQRSEDYEALRERYRPGHADITYMQKYGTRDPRGGGRSSARETALRVVAGAMARQWLMARYGVEIFAYADEVGRAYNPDEARDKYPYSYEAIKARQGSLLRCPDPTLEDAMMREIELARSEGDSVGGVVACIAYHVPHGLGEPLYDKLEARLAEAMLSINATRAFEIGEGFGSARSRGSKHNDAMARYPDGEAVLFRSNHSGGTLGGISTGQDLRMRVAFKPTPSIALPQETYAAITDGVESHVLQIEGRHDPCVVPRAIAVVEAMCALVLMDMALIGRPS